MKPSQLRTLLAAAIANRVPVLITGAPGGAKTSVVEQATADANADMILSHPAVEDPTDAKGLPWIAKEKDRATFLPFGQLARAIEAKRDTVWFLDDLGQAPPAVQASYMQLLLARQVNGHKLPDCVTFVAATNRRTDRAGVSGILEPVKSRFGAIVELSVDLDEWCTWAFANGIPAEVIAFMRFRPELLSKFAPSSDLTNSPSPRGWAMAAKWLGMKLPTQVLLEAVGGAVGAGAAVELISFLDLWKSMPSVDGILLDPDAALIPDKPAAKYAIVTALGMKATQANFDRIARYAQRLIDNQQGEFAALLARDSIRRSPNVQQTAGFIQLAAGGLGDILSGSTAAK